MTEQPPESPEDDFDAFVAQHNIQPHEMGAAFAAWLSGFGWDGNYAPKYEHLPFPVSIAKSQDTNQEVCGPHQ